MSPLKIAIVGPESTGKSSITVQLAKHYHASMVAEQARDYIQKLQRPYTLQDITAIAQLQIEAEAQEFAQTQSLLICDTTVLVTKIWAENAFQTCPEFILHKWDQQDYGLHLLMNIDLPWEADPQREHPHLRTFFFNWYENELIKAKANYCIISGLEEERLSNAIAAVDNFLKLRN